MVKHVLAKNSTLWVYCYILHSQYTYPRCVLLKDLWSWYSEVWKIYFRYNLYLRLHDLSEHTENSEKSDYLQKTIQMCCAAIVRHQYRDNVFMIGSWDHVQLYCRYSLDSSSRIHTACTDCSHRQKTRMTTETNGDMNECWLCMTKILPHSNMNPFLWLKVEVVCVVQALIERLLKIDKIWHPHWKKERERD